MAKEDGSIDGVKRQRRTMDTAIMGNKAYRQIHTLAKESPYQEMQKGKKGM